MATRTSIELHPDGCRLADVHVPPRREAPAGDVRVRAFVADVEGAGDPAALGAALARLRATRKLPRTAWVTIWGLRSTQQLLRLPPARPGDLEALATREARKDIAPFEADGEGASVVVVPGAEVQVGQHRRREVSLVAVSTADVRTRIQPLADAGFEVAGVVTPALALAAVARGRREHGSDATVAYVALGRRATCLAIIRDGVLLFAREMAWGHESVAAGEAIDVRMASELRRSILYFKQTFRTAVESLVLCGDMPSLRSLTAPVGSALGMPVETLDSLAGIDAASVPEPADAFRADVAALRLVIATGADTAPAANLLPLAIRRARESRREVTRLAAGAAAGLLLTIGWYFAVDTNAAVSRGEVAALERQLAVLEPEATRLADARRAYDAATSRQAALSAFDTQGPRLARLLEAISAKAPTAVMLRSITAEADGERWRATVSGIAVADDVAAAQVAVNTFLNGMSGSPFAGPPAEPPALRVVSGGGSATQALADGTSGVEFTVHFLVAK